MCMCAQYIDLIISPNCNCHKTWRLFLTPSSFLRSPVLLIYFLKSCYFFTSIISCLNSCKVPDLDPNPSPFLDTAALVLLSKGRATLLNFFPLINIESNILHEASIVRNSCNLPCLVSHQCIPMLWALVTVACSWFYTLVILAAIKGPLYVPLYLKQSPPLPLSS